MSSKSLVFFLCLFVLGLLTGCNPAGLHPDDDNTPPKARFRIVPNRGDTTMVFVLNGQASTDREDINLFLEFRWDLDGDGAWDTEFEDYPYLIARFPDPGIHLVVMEVRDRYGLTATAEATVTTWGINNDTSHLIDPRDGQWYKTVRIKGMWWMAENLNIGLMIQDPQLPADNGIYEKYCYLNDPSAWRADGGYLTYYDWDEVMDWDTLSTQGLCPPGWRIPTRTDWDSLLTPFGGKGLVSHFAEGGFSRLNLTRIGIHELTKPWETIDDYPVSAYWMYWTREYTKEPYRRGYRPCPFVRSSRYFYRGNNNDAQIRFVNDSIRTYGGAVPVRCVKEDSG
ncbi:MAG: FISUMP domain-containing protein, partial [Bacteroidales bacterium]